MTCEEEDLKEKADTEKFIEEVTRPHRKFINDTPALTSLLYDIDLLPEQIRLPVNAVRMSAVCEIFKVLTEDQIKSLFTKTA